VTTRARNTADIVEDTAGVVGDVNTALGLKLDYATPFVDQSGSGSAAYTFVLSDGSRLVNATASAAKTFIIPPESSVNWPTNTTIRVSNRGTGLLTISGGSGVTVQNGSKTIGPFQSAEIIRSASDSWTLISNSLSSVSGTWTASLPNGGTIDSPTQQYIVTGDLVVAAFTSRMRSVPNNSNTFLIAGLPFPANWSVSSSLGQTQRLNINPLKLYIGSGSSQVSFWQSQISTGGFTSQMTNAVPASAVNDFDINFVLTYRKAS
jgi:hypothetical protein